MALSESGMEISRRALWFGGAVIFMLGGLVAAASSWLQPIVTVKLVNHANQPIEKLFVDYSNSQSARGYQELILPEGGIGVGKEMVFHLFTESEAAYKLSLTLADGEFIQGGKGYVSAGDVVREEIRPDAILSERCGWFGKC